MKRIGETGKRTRMVGILLVVALAVSCVAGGTLAKYVTEGEGNDSARVAKWGVKVGGEGNAFQKEYGNDDVEADVPTVVKSNVEVVAPGTYGTFDGIDVSGTPEVAVDVSTNADLNLGVKEDSENGNWIDKNNKFYCPIVIEVNSVQFCGLAYDSAAAFENDVERAINTYMSEKYEPGTNLGEEKNLNDSIEWRWAFSSESLNDISSDVLKFNEGTKETLSSKQNDEKDTYLGDKAAGGSAPTIALTLTTTVTQID